MPERIPLTVAFLNRKGGVGKTSTCHHLAGVYAEFGRKVLLVDADPQASLTQGLLGAKAALALAPAETIASLFQDAYEPDPKHFIHRTRFENLFLAPASVALNQFNLPTGAHPPHHQVALATFMAAAERAFDVILIDCPPTLNLCSWAALLAARGVVVPVVPEDYGAQGIIHVNELVNWARVSNPRLKLLGYLLTMVTPRLAIHRAYRHQLVEQYGDAVFRASVPHRTAYKEAITVQTPITQYKPRSPAARAMREVAEELFYRARAAETVSESA